MGSIVVLLYLNKIGAKHKYKVLKWFKRNMVIIIWMIVLQMATVFKVSLVRSILKGQHFNFVISCKVYLIHLEINFKSVSFLHFSFHPLSEVPREAWLDHLIWIRSLLQSVMENETGEDVRWDELQDTLHFIAVLSSAVLLLQRFPTQ